MKKMLVLPMKKKWFDMILSGKKKEEYREFKPYWNSRVDKWQIANREIHTTVFLEVDFNSLLPILFINGYGIKAPQFIGWCNGYSVRSTVMHKEWGEGAYEGVGHYAFHISRIERTN